MYADLYIFCPQGKACCIYLEKLIELITNYIASFI